MKLARFGAAGAEIPAVIDDDGVVRDLRTVISDITPAFLATDLRTVVGDVHALPVLVDAARLRRSAPVPRPGKIVCVGLNYRDHAAETGAAIPDEPVVFMKDPSTVIGPDDQVLIPRGSMKTDWEVELAIVIGRAARYCATEQDAADCIAGYTLVNDVSERAFQLERGGQWDKGKSCETFNPLGPWLVTPDEVDPDDVTLQLRVNGALRQDGSTRNMVFRPTEIVRYLSQFMVLHPGDVINTGTPAGVALGGGAPYLCAGDVVELTGSGLGSQRQEVGAA